MGIETIGKALKSVFVIAGLTRNCLNNKQFLRKQESQKQQKSIQT